MYVCVVHIMEMHLLISFMLCFTQSPTSSLLSIEIHCGSKKTCYTIYKNNLKEVMINIVYSNTFSLHEVTEAVALFILANISGQALFAANSLVCAEVLPLPLLLLLPPIMGVMGQSLMSIP